MKFKDSTIEVNIEDNHKVYFIVGKHDGHVSGLILSGAGKDYDDFGYLFVHSHDEKGYSTGCQIVSTDLLIKAQRAGIEVEELIRKALLEAELQSYHYVGG